MTIIKTRCPECGKPTQVDSRSLDLLTGENPYYKTMSREDALELLSLCDICWKMKRRSVRRTVKKLRPDFKKT